MQTIIVDCVPSDPKPVISGVPQGSVLGPLIFLTSIGDIDDNVQHSSTRGFADDTRLIKAIIDAIDGLYSKMIFNQSTNGLVLTTWNSTMLNLNC